MMQRIKMTVAALIFAVSVGGSTLAIATPQTVSAKACSKGVLLFPTWYRGVSTTEGSGDTATCEIDKPDKNLSNFIWTIGLNVVEMALVLVGYIAVGYIIWGGFQYMLVATNADRTVAARKTIVNAVAGLILSLFAAVIVNIVVNNVLDKS